MGKVGEKKTPGQILFFHSHFFSLEYSCVAFVLLCKHLERYNYVHSKSQSREFS